MPVPAEPLVAFSLSAPLAAAARTVFGAPRRAFVPALVLLLPLIPLLAGVAYVLREGGSADLQGWIAGAPAGSPNVLIAEPGTDGQLRLAALGALLVGVLSTVVAAGLVSGAAARGERYLPRPRPGIRRTVAEWPSLLVALTVQLLLVAVVVAGLVVLADLAGGVRFQFGTVVLVVGLLPLAIALVRASLWPALAVRDGAPAWRALRDSWRLLHGSVVRLCFAAAYAAICVVVPALVLRWLIDLGLTALADAGVIALSPIAIDLWALLPIPVGALVLVVLWGHEAPRLLDDAARFAAERQPASGG